MTNNFVTAQDREKILDECDFLRRKLAETRKDNLCLKAENFLLKKLTRERRSSLYSTSFPAQFVAPVDTL
jgi:hypothetical protein